MKAMRKTNGSVLLLVLLFGDAGWADDGEDIALGAIEGFPRMSSRIKRDGNLEGKPIVSVDLGFTKMTDKGLKELAGLKHLKKLYLHRTEVTDTGLKVVAGFDRLEMLYLGGTKVTDAGLKELSGLKRLQLLDLRLTKVTESGAAEFQKTLPTVKISLGGDKILEPKKPTDDGDNPRTGVEEAVTALEKLGARMNGTVKDAAKRPVRGVLLSKKEVWDYRRRLGALEGDARPRGRVHHRAEEGDRRRARAPGRAEEARHDRPGWDARRGQAPVHLKDMTRIHKLGLWRTAVDDEGMVHLKGLVNLEHLYLDKTNVSDKGIEALGSNPSLCNVTWEGSRVTEKGESLMKKSLPSPGQRYGPD